MGRFLSPANQASSLLLELKNNGSIKSLGTARNYQQALTRVGEFAKSHKMSLRDMTREYAEQYLCIRGENVEQKTLDMERQSIQLLLHLTGHLAEKETLTAISEIQQILSSRAYTQMQVEMIIERQNTNNSLATEISYSAGLRAHELFTLLPVIERAADERPALASKFLGRDGAIYTVKGKGGLVREVLIPHNLVKRLENRRLINSVKVIDRTIYYTTYYDLSGGNKFSASFNIASNKALERSTGAHGLRHSFAQERMQELQTLGLSRALSLETVSQEMGHFRPKITEIYLR